MLSFLLALADSKYQDKIKRMYKFQEDALQIAKNRLKQANMPNYQLDAEDIVQNVYLYFIQNLKTIDFRKSDEQLRAIVISHTTSAVSEYIEIGHESFVDIDDCICSFTDDDIIDNMQNRENYRRIVNLMSRIDEKYSHLMVLRYIEDLDVKQISKQIHKSEREVVMMLNRARRMIFHEMRLEEEQKQDSNDENDGK